MSGVLGQVIYTSELDPAYRPARPPVLLTCTDVQPEAGWAHSGHIRRGRDDAATCQPCLDSVCAQGAALVASRGSQGLAPASNACRGRHEPGRWPRERVRGCPCACWPWLIYPPMQKFWDDALKGGS